MNNKVLMKLSNVRKSFGNLKVLKGIDLTINKGEIISILGPSGSGKSTLLRTMNYLENADDGKMFFKDSEIEMTSLKEKEKQELRKEFSMVFQHYNLFNNKRVIDNITEGLIITKKMNKKDANDMALKYLEKVNLLDKADSYPHQLSGGQKQRVGIARALAMEPSMILFDEPTSALDPELVGEVLKVIRDLAKEDITMIIVTHEMEFAREISDRIVFMDEGMVISEASSKEFFEEQENPRVLSFIGSL